MYKKEITCGRFVIAIGNKSQDNSGMNIIVYTTVGKNSERVIKIFSKISLQDMHVLLKQSDKS